MGIIGLEGYRMGDLQRKFQFKNQRHMLVMNVPEEVSFFVDELADADQVKHKPGKADLFDFILVFAKTTAEISKFTGMISTHIAEDALLWFAYPKKSSKRYSSDVSREEGWNPLGALGYEPVRQVAVTEDWSALRFRHIKYIKQLNRSKLEAISEEGLIRTANRRKKNGPSGK